MVKITEVPFDQNSKADLGEIKITTGVLESIAAQAASEVAGVVHNEQGLQKQMGSFLGLDRDNINAKITYQDDLYTIDISLNVYYGYSVPEVAIQVQEKVKEQILFMTDLAIREVNVHVVSIETNQNPRSQSQASQAED